MLNPHRLHHHVYDKKDHDLARNFANKLKTELDILLKEVIFFGSAKRSMDVITELTAHDIDVLVIVDDLKKVFSNEVIEAYRIITEQTARSVSTRLHINTIKLSQFWEYISNGDPIALNILREGMPLLDQGLVEPLQELLKRGQIRPTKENVWVYFLKAPQTLSGAQFHMLQAAIDLYWAALDATHTALLVLDKAPNSPKEAEQMLNDILIKEYLFPKKYLKTLNMLHRTMLQIQDRSIKEIDGKTYDLLFQSTRDYIDYVKLWISDYKAKL